MGEKFYVDMAKWERGHLNFTCLIVSVVSLLAIVYFSDLNVLPGWLLLSVFFNFLLGLVWHLSSQKKDKEKTRASFLELSDSGLSIEYDGRRHAVLYAELELDEVKTTCSFVNMVKLKTNHRFKIKLEGWENMNRTAEIIEGNVGKNRFKVNG